MPLFKKLSVKTLNAALIFFIVVVFLVVSFMCYQSLLRIDTDEFWVIHSYQVQAGLDALISDLENMETGERGYILTGQQIFLQPYATALPDVNANFQTVRGLTTDNPVQQQYLSQMQPLIIAKMADLQNNILLRTNEGFAAAEGVLRRTTAR